MYDEAQGEPATNNPQKDNIAVSADIVVSGSQTRGQSTKDISPSSLTKNKVDYYFNFTV